MPRLGPSDAYKKPGPRTLMARQLDD